MAKVIELNKKTSIILYPKASYNFDASVHKPSHFPSSDNFWEKGKYWITMVWQGKYLGLKLENKGTISKPKIKVIIFSEKPLDSKFVSGLVPEIKHRFNTESDISEFIKKFKNDKVLSPFIKRWNGMKPVAANSLYETLIIYIVLQNATVRRTRQMLENLFNAFGKKVKFDGKVLSTSWEPKKLDKVPEQKLRYLKLGYRAKSIKKISEQFSQGEIDEMALRKMGRDEAKKEILKLYGIGPASVEYLLLEDFYHCDAFETVPPWEQKILSRLLFKKSLVPVEKILKYADKQWGKWKKLAIHYIWEDIFWQRQKGKKIPWLEKEIRL